MTTIHHRRCARLASLAALALAIGGAQPASADVACNQELGACFQRAAAIGGTWERLAYSLDCELSYAQCASRGLDF